MMVDKVTFTNSYEDDCDSNNDDDVDDDNDDDDDDLWNLRLAFVFGEHSK